MPGVLPIYDPFSKATIDAWNSERKQRKQHIDDLWQWREGLHPNSLKVLPDQYDDNLTLNLCGQVVDDVSDFMGIPEIKLQGDVSDEAQMYFQAVKDENGIDALLSDMIEAGNVAGHVFVRLSIPDGTPIGNDGLPIFDNEWVPEISLIDARYVTIFWDIRRPNRKNVIWYRLAWMVGDAIWVQDIVPSWYMPEDQRMAGDYWQIIEYLDKNGSGRYEEQGRDVFPYAFAPITEWKNARRPHEYYGKSTLTEPTVRLNKSINFLGTNMMRIIRFHAHPKTAIIGADLDNVDVRPDGLITLPEGSQVMNIEMQSDLTSSSNFMGKLESRLFSERRVVDQSNVVDKVGNLTNFGVRMLYINMTKMITDRWHTYGEGLTMLFDRLLVMLRIEGKPDVVWANPLPENRLELVQQAVQENTIGGTSMQSLLDLMGRDYDTELAQRQVEAAQEMDMRTAERDNMSRRGIF